MKMFDSIRRAETSDQSRGPNGLIQPPACQNELAPGPAGRPVGRFSLALRLAQPSRPEFAPGQARYAERKLATGREVLLALRLAKSIRPEFAPGQARYAEREPATSRVGPMV